MVCSSRKALLAAVAGVFLAGGIAVRPASAQLYFRPFFKPFAYAYSYDYPEHDEAPARYASRRAVASILAREGFRLVGPLGRHGEQIVATGYSRRDGDMRFLVDPYEGRIIRGTRIAPPDDHTGPRRDDEPEYVLPLGGSRPVVRDISRDEETPRASRPRRERSARLREAPDREWVTIDGQERAAAPRRITPETPAKPAAESAKRRDPRPVEAKPIDTRPPEPKPQQAKQGAPAAAKPAEEKPSEAVAARPAPRIVYPAPAAETEPDPVAAKPAAKSAKRESAKLDPTTSEPNTTIIAKPAPAASTPAGARATAPTPKTAANSGGSSHRAIVPPTTGPAASASTNGAN